MFGPLFPVGVGIFAAVSFFIGSMYGYFHGRHDGRKEGRAEAFKPMASAVRKAEADFCPFTLTHRHDFYVADDQEVCAHCGIVK